MKIYHILMIIFLVFVSGCASSPSEDIDKSGVLLGGDKGMVFEISSLPPAVSEGSQFSFEVFGINHGEDSPDSGEIKISLSNSNSFDFTLIDTSNQYVEGEILNNNNKVFRAFEEGIPGDRVVFNFDDLIYTSGIISREEKIPVTVQSCYSYETRAYSDICISEETFGDVCNAAEEKEVFSSGAPISVSKVEQVNSLRTGSNTQATIHSTIIIEISASNEGQFYTGSSEEFSCDDLSRGGTVRLKSIRIGSRDITELDNICGGSEIISLDDAGKGRVVCNLETYLGWTPSLGDFVERMEIKVDYLHSQIITEEISVIPN